MTEQRLNLGRLGEEAAANYLMRMGMKILARNLRTPVGEIDLVAKDKRNLVFIEVKTRSGKSFGAPAEAVVSRKQQQVIRAASWYLNDQGAQGLQPRFDVVAVLCNAGGLEVEHIPNAFQL